MHPLLPDRLIVVEIDIKGLACQSIYVDMRNHADLMEQLLGLQARLSGYWVEDGSKTVRDPHPRGTPPERRFMQKWDKLQGERHGPRKQAVVDAEAVKQRARRQRAKKSNPTKLSKRAMATAFQHMTTGKDAIHPQRARQALKHPEG